jgi:hypothetical protein
MQPHGLVSGDLIRFMSGGQNIDIIDDNNNISDITTINFDYHTLVAGSYTVYTEIFPNSYNSNINKKTEYQENFLKQSGYTITKLTDDTFSINLPFNDFYFYFSDPNSPVLLSEYLLNTEVNATPTAICTFIKVSGQDNFLNNYNIDNSLYMLSNKLGGNLSTSNDTNKLDRVYAKIQLAGEHGDIVYNSYIGGQKIYYDSPLSDLIELDFEFRDKNGNLYNFENMDHSFTLEILETIQKVKGTDYNARLGNSITTRN